LRALYLTVSAVVVLVVVVVVVVSKDKRAKSGNIHIKQCFLKYRGTGRIGQNRTLIVFTGRIQCRGPRCYVLSHMN
jgi:preprotein translocase subunit SecG